MKPDEFLNVPALDDDAIERKRFDWQDHDWTQVGYELNCPGVNCSMAPNHHGTRIKSRQLLEGERGKWRLVDEVTRR